MMFLSPICSQIDWREISQFPIFSIQIKFYQSERVQTTVSFIHYQIQKIKSTPQSGQDQTNMTHAYCYIAKEKQGNRKKWQTKQKHFKASYNHAKQALYEEHTVWHTNVQRNIDLLVQQTRKTLVKLRLNYILRPWYIGTRI